MSVFAIVFISLHDKTELMKKLVVLSMSVLLLVTGVMAQAPVSPLAEGVKLLNYEKNKSALDFFKTKRTVFLVWNLTKKTLILVWNTTKKHDFYLWNLAMFRRIIDFHLKKWKTDDFRKPLLLRGARQVGKTFAVRQLGKQFSSFVEINFEKLEGAAALFEKDLDPDRLILALSLLLF